jgi:hypothetical protein
LKYNLQEDNQMFIIIIKIQLKLTKLTNNTKISFLLN